MNFETLKNTVRVKVREETNPMLGKFRRKKLKDPNVTIISNNCWGGHVYRYFGLPYMSPTIGLYFYAEDYVKFCSKLEYYLEQELKFIDASESSHTEDVKKKKCPIGKLDDIEIVFLHYKSEEEAFQKWERRKERINMKNIVFKFSEQNLCLPEHVLAFDSLPYSRKLVFTTEDYGFNSQVLWGGSCVKGNIPNDTILFREYVDLANFMNGNEFRRKQKKARKRLETL